jgi:hypothetical protein
MSRVRNRHIFERQQPTCLARASQWTTQCVVQKQRATEVTRKRHWMEGVAGMSLASPTFAAQSRFAGFAPRRPAARLPVSASRKTISRASAPDRQTLTGLLWSLHLQGPRQAPASRRHSAPSLSRSLPRSAPDAVRPPSEVSVFVSGVPSTAFRKGTPETKTFAFGNRGRSQRFALTRIVVERRNETNRNLYATHKRQCHSKRPRPIIPRNHRIRQAVHAGTLDVGTTSEGVLLWSRGDSGLGESQSLG